MGLLYYSNHSALPRGLKAQGNTRLFRLTFWKFLLALLALPTKSLIFSFIINLKQFHQLFFAFSCSLLRIQYAALEIDTIMWSLCTCKAVPTNTTSIVHLFTWNKIPFCITCFSTVENRRNTSCRNKAKGSAYLFCPSW